MPRGLIPGVAALALAAGLAARPSPPQSRSPFDLTLGRLLVADPRLTDPNFTKTVVLLVRYENPDVVGLILNRGSGRSLSQVLATMDAARDRTDEAYTGGPVETQVAFALLRAPNPPRNSTPVLGDVYFSTSRATIEAALDAATASTRFRLYIGYAGWSRAQLDHEVATGSWFVMPATVADVFDPHPATLWTRLIARTQGHIARRAPQTDTISPEAP